MKSKNVDALANVCNYNWSIAREAWCDDMESTNQQYAKEYQRAAPWYKNTAGQQKLEMVCGVAFQLRGEYREIIITPQNQPLIHAHIKFPPNNSSYQPHCKQKLTRCYSFGRKRKRQRGSNGYFRLYFWNVEPKPKPRPRLSFDTLISTIWFCI